MLWEVLCCCGGGGMCLWRSVTTASQGTQRPDQFCWCKLTRPTSQEVTVLLVYFSASSPSGKNHIRHFVYLDQTVSNCIKNTSKVVSWCSLTQFDPNIQNDICGFFLMEINGRSGTIVINLYLVQEDLGYIRTSSLALFCFSPSSISSVFHYT